MTAEKVQQLIEDDLEGARAFVSDTKGTGDHFQAVVIAPQFEGESKVNQHRLVYKACGEYLTREIHALQLQTYSPAEWEIHNSEKD